MNPSTALATVLVDELIACGVTDAVLCPGSRNAPLSMALHSADVAGRIRLHVRIDERTAGFLALGLAKGSGRPVPVVTTSGTAVANLHPAVLEAHHGRVPVIVLSADRPPVLRDVGANQTVDQRGLFGTAVRFQHEFALPVRATGQNAHWRSMICRALAHARGLGAAPGPVHLNLPLAEPLVPEGGDGAGRNSACGDGAGRNSAGGDGGSMGSACGDQPGEDPAGSHTAAAVGAALRDWPESLAGRTGPWTTVHVPDSYPGDPEWRSAHPAGPSVPGPVEGERCMVIAAFDAQVPAMGRFVPVVAEAGGLAGSTVLAHGVDLLATPAIGGTLRPDRVIVLGRPTLYRQVGALLADPEVIVDVWDDPRAYADPAGTARMVSAAGGNWAFWDRTDPWMAAWRAADAAASAAVRGVLGGRDITSSPVLARTLAAALPAGATLVVGSSQSPRDLGRFAEPRDDVRIVANRGVAGIDGTISTAIGVALADQRSGAGSAAGGRPGAGRRTGRKSGPTVALLGDLAFLHDLTGLVIGPNEPVPDLTIVVANNDGGGIFAGLEPGAPQHASAFERVFGTPTGARLRPIVQGLGAEHVPAATAEQLVEAVRTPPRGIRVVEVPVARTDLREQLAAVTAAVQDAVR